VSKSFPFDDWKTWPVVTGRVAAEPDLASGAAVFHQQGRGVAYASERELPALAIARIEGRSEEKVVVVQMEKTPTGEILCGARNIEGRDLVCMLDELTFVENFP